MPARARKPRRRAAASSSSRSSPSGRRVIGTMRKQGSVLGQSHRDVQLILVNDGSRDGSAAIMDAYAQRDPRVVAVMLPFFTEHFGNPHSAEHSMGRFAEAAVETARGHVAGDLIGRAKPCQQACGPGHQPRHHLQRMASP